MIIFTPRTSYSIRQTLSSVTVTTEQWRLFPLEWWKQSPPTRARPSSGNCKRQRREAAIAKGKKPLPTRESEGAS